MKSDYDFDYVLDSDGRMLFLPKAYETMQETKNRLMLQNTSDVLFYLKNLGKTDGGNK